MASQFTIHTFNLKVCKIWPSLSAVSHVLNNHSPLILVYQQPITEKPLFTNSQSLPTFLYQQPITGKPLSTNNQSLLTVVNQQPITGHLSLPTANHWSPLFITSQSLENHCLLTANHWKTIVDQQQITTHLCLPTAKHRSPWFTNSQ